MERTLIFNKVKERCLIADASIFIFKLGCLLGVLTGCATAPVPREVAYSRMASQGLYALQPWLMSGRLALTATNDSWQADINWEHRADMEEIKLSGPLGQGSVAIRLTRNYVTIARGGNDVEISDQPEQFISQQLGLFVPVRSLRYWVLGLPMPDTVFEDSGGGFKQEGWEVDYPQMQTVDGKLVPRKIIVKNDQVKLKLFIDQWKLNGNEAQ